MDTVYRTFTTLMQYLGTFNGEIPEDKAPIVTAFYKTWRSYLTPTNFIMNTIRGVGEFIVKQLFYFLSALETVFYKLFDLFNVFGYLADPSNIFGKFYLGFSVLGVAIFTLFLVVKAIYSMVGKPLKVSKIVQQFLLVTITFFVLPPAITSFATVTKNMAESVRTVSDGTVNSADITLASIPFRDNIVDVKQLIDADFNLDNISLDSDNYIIDKPNSSFAKNTLTSSTIPYTNLTATYGVQTLKETEALDSKKDGIKGLFLHRLNDDGSSVQSMTQHGQGFLDLTGFMNIFEPVYPRYVINWIPLIAELLLLILILFSMSIKVAKSILDVLLTSILSPILGYMSVDKSSKFKELLITIFTGVASVFFEMTILVVLLAFLKYLPSLAIYTGLDYWQRIIMTLILYIALFMTAMSGINILERYLGISTGQGDSMTSLLGIGMGFGALASATKGVGNAVKGTFKGSKKLGGSAKNGFNKLSDKFSNNGGGDGGGGTPPVAPKQDKETTTPPITPKQEKETTTPPAERKQEKEPTDPPIAPKQEKETTTPPAERKQEKEPTDPPVAPKQEKEPTDPPVAPKQDKEPTDPPVAPKQDKEPTDPPVAPKQEKEPTDPPVAPKQEKEPTDPPVAPKQDKKSSVRVRDDFKKSSYHANQSMTKLQQAMMYMSSNRNNQSQREREDD